MKTYLLVPATFLMCILWTSNSIGQAPDWLTKHMEYLTQESGTWLADNSEYMNSAEPTDTYATDWNGALESKALQDGCMDLRMEKRRQPTGSSEPSGIP